MSRTVFDILEELEGTQGKNARIEILEVARKNDLLKQVFVAAQDPYTVYYVNKFKAPEPCTRRRPESSDAVLETFLNTLGILSRRELTGNAAKDRVVADFADMTAVEQKWCLRILLKNLRVGLQESSINKVWPGTLKSFAVALAEVLKSEFVKGEGIKILEPVAYPVRVEPKLDGLRCIAIKKVGVVTFFTRNGTELESMPKIKAVLEGANYDDIVLDGEGMAADWNESASVMMSGRGSNKDHKKDDSNLYYNVFDAMSLKDWVSQKCDVQYEDRCAMVADVVTSCSKVKDTVKRVRQVPHIMAKNEKELKAYFAKCMDEGYEGVMLKKLDTPYKFKRSENIVKLKPCVTYEGVIVGSYEGRRGTKREGLFGGFYVVLPNQVITRVGGGFKDELKAQIQFDGPETWNGKIPECEAQPDPLTSDGLSAKGKMRFPVFCRIRSASDVDPKVPATYKWWKSLAADDRTQRLDAMNRDKEED